MASRDRSTQDGSTGEAGAADRLAERQVPAGREPVPAGDRSRRRILYLPLDERPCNYLFPQLQLPPSSGVDLLMPPRAFLGRKKEPADREALMDWLARELPGSEHAVVSLEMLLYGGLLPSRVHQDQPATIRRLLERFAAILRRSGAGPGGPEVSLFGLIMRTPAYSSDEEEPDYYAHYGRQIFLRGYLDHKHALEGLSAREEALLGSTACIPATIISDYERRRRTNLESLYGVGELLREGLVRRFVLPEDDTAEFGYGPREKAAVLARFAELGVGDRVHSYPGADEVGMVLTARAATSLRTVTAGSGFDSTEAGESSRVARVYVLYSHEAARRIVPKYESQSLERSVAAQIDAVGAVEVGDPAAADIVLGVAAPAGSMIEAAEQSHAPAAASETEAFVDSLMALQAGGPGRVCALADCVHANGSDRHLVELLSRRGAWGRLAGYAGWNTAGNTLGTVLARALLEWRFPDASARLRNLSYRLLDDWAYQTHIRTRAREELAGAPPAGPSAGVPPAVRASVEAGLRADWLALLELCPSEQSAAGHGLAAGTGLPAEPGLRGICFPWDRLFEIQLELGEEA